MRLGSTFRFAINLVTHSSVTYIDVQVLFFANSRLFNNHVYSFPSLIGHTGMTMLEDISKVVNMLMLDWKIVLYDYKSDSACCMTVRNIGVFTCFQPVFERGMSYVWCKLQLVIHFQRRTQGIISIFPHDLHCLPVASAEYCSNTWSSFSEFTFTCLQSMYKVRTSSNIFSWDYLRPDVTNNRQIRPYLTRGLHAVA